MAIICCVKGSARVAFRHGLLDQQRAVASAFSFDYISVSHAQCDVGDTAIEKAQHRKFEVKKSLFVLLGSKLICFYCACVRCHCGRDCDK